MSCFIWYGTATMVSTLPNMVITPEPSRRRKSRESRSGLRSMRRRSRSVFSDRDGLVGTGGKSEWSGEWRATDFSGEPKLRGAEG
ncbi:hypothetical protein GCM10022226_63540 [Sphaerisporangium flaviroseum]|uniref:Uncharacterized protein n=1 Tax=Sphaerisporangium flaviroseum TaxID=509199 RepID=A0ABP7J3N0_9ACTN